MAIQANILTQSIISAEIKKFSSGSDYYESGYNDGFIAGEAAKQAEFDEKIYIGTFVGSGTETQSIAIPFEPDSVCVYCYSDAIYNADVQTIMLYHADLCSVGTVGSYSVYYRQKNGLGAGTSTASTLKRCVYQDGILTMTPRGEGSGVVFDNTSTYTIIAIANEE